MKRANRWLSALGLIAMTVFAQGALAATCTSISSNNWGNPTTWDCGHVPLATDTVVITSGFTVRLNNNYTVAALTINAGGTINDNGNNLTVNGNITVNGTFGVVGGGGSLIANGTNVTISGTGTFADSILEINNSATIPAGSTLNFSAGGQIDVGPNAPPPGTVTLNIAGTITGTGQQNGNTILNGNGNANITVASGGSINAPVSDITLVAGDVLTNNGAVSVQTLTTDPGVPWTQGANSSLTLSGDPTVFQGMLNASAAGNSVNYSGAGQTVILPSGAPATYYNLTLSGSGTATMPATAMTVAGNFTMSGTVSTSAAAALTVGGNFGIGAGTTFANSTSALNVAGNFAQNGTFTAGTGVVTLNGGAAVQTISGTGALGFANLTVSNTGGITLARNVTVTSAIIGTVTLTSTCPIDYTLTSNGGATVQHSCLVSGPNHIRVQHDGNGLTCTPETLTVIACANAACTAPNYTASAVTGNVTWTGAPGGSVPFNITTGGTTTVSLPVTTVQTVTLGTSAVSPAPLNPSDCWNTTTATASCSLPFADSGLLVSAPNHVAETVQNMTVSAVRKANNALNCVPAFANVSRAVNLKCAYANPITGTLSARVAGVALNAANNAAAACDGTGQSPTLAFNASGVATTTLQYADAGQMTLNATYTGSVGTGDVGLVMTGSGSFIAKPDHFDLTAIQQTAAPNLANPAAANAAGAKFVKAGEAFSVTVTARNFANAATPNFGKETSPESVKLTPALVAGLGLTNNPVISGTFGTFTGGVATGTNFTWNEVGIITLTPSILSGNYLGVAGNVTGTATGNVGRFYAAKFALSAGAIANRTDIAACAVAGCGSFTYMSERFDAQFTLTAQAMGGATTQNYTTANSFAKLNPAAAGNPLVFGAIDSAATRTPLTARLDTSLPTTGSFGVGVATVAAPLAITRGGAADGPYAALDIGIAPADSDGVIMSAYDLDTDAVVGNDHTKVARTEVRYGRIKLANAHGSELLSLPITATVQYWNGASYVTSATDSATQFNTQLSPAGNVQATIVKGPLALGNVSVVTPGLATFANGVKTFTLAAPNVAGSVDLAIITAPSYLLPSTTGRATFGVYKGANEFIYLRENY